MQSRPLWRVGLAIFILGMIYVAAEVSMESAYMLLLLLPIYMLLEPAPEDLCETFPKAKADGMPFYLFKWTGISLLASVGLLLFWFLVVGAYAAQLGITDAVFKDWNMKALYENIKEYFFVVLVPIILMVFASWVTRSRHYKKLCLNGHTPKKSGLEQKPKKTNNRKKTKRRKK